MLTRAPSMMLGCFGYVLSWEGTGLLLVMLQLHGPQSIWFTHVS